MFQMISKSQKSDEQEDTWLGAKKMFFSDCVTGRQQNICDVDVMYVL